MKASRIVAGIALALVLVVALPTAVSALWSSRGTAAATVTAGRVQFAASGFETLTVVFGSTEASRVAVAPVTVRNTGTVPAPYTLQLGAETANNVARAVKVSVWLVPVEADCTAAAPVPSGVTTVDWPILPAVTGSLAPTESAVYCVRSVISAADVEALPGQSAVPTLRLTSTFASWTHEARARATQSVARQGGGAEVTPMPAPVDPVSMQRSGPASDAVSDADTDPSADTDTEPTNATDTAAAAADTDTADAGPEAYTGDSAADSDGPAYAIGAAGMTWCAGTGTGTTDAPDSAVLLTACDGSAGQSWRLSGEEGGYRRILSASDPSRAWTADGTALGTAPVQPTADAQHWALRADADGTTSIVSRATGACVTVPPIFADGDAAGTLALAPCDGSAAQDLVLAVLS